jgi:hypothetical protein
LEMAHMHEDLVSGRDNVNLSPLQALDEAKDFLVKRDYRVMRRTATTLTVEREDSNAAAKQEGTPCLVVIAVPQPDGGVRIKIRGSDRKGVREGQTQGSEWMDTLPKRPSAPMVRVKGVPMRRSGRSSGIRRLLSANVILWVAVLIALVAILMLVWLAMSLLF